MKLMPIILAAGLLASPVWAQSWQPCMNNTGHLAGDECVPNTFPWTGNEYLGTNVSGDLLKCRSGWTLVMTEKGAMCADHLEEPK